jgi:predicted ArsR family transcriptional regulator
MTRLSDFIERKEQVLAYLQKHGESRTEAIRGALKMTIQEARGALESLRKGGMVQKRIKKLKVSGTGVRGFLPKWLFGG